jgi:hypothetical protein
MTTCARDTDSELRRRPEEEEEGGEGEGTYLLDRLFGVPARGKRLHSVINRICILYELLPTFHKRLHPAPFLR